MVKSLIGVSFIAFVVGCAGKGSSDDLGLNPNCNHSVYRHDPNGWLLKTPELHLDFYGSYWSNNPSESSLFEAQWESLLTNGTALQRLSEYGIVQGTIDSNYYNTDLSIDTSLSSVDDAGITLDKLGMTDDQSLIDDSAIPSQINSDIQAGILPLPNDNTIYVIVLPPYVGTKSMTGKGYYAYHSHYAYGSSRYAFAVIHYGDSDTINVSIAHETYEAASNPDGNGYYDDNAIDGEIGDFCDRIPEYIDGIVVQKVWSEASCVCL